MAAAAGSGGGGSTKPRWLIAGGMGMVGRNLVKYLLDNNLASDIRVADKKLPFIAFLSADHKAAMEHEMVEAVMCDVADDEFADKIFAEPRTGGTFDYVVNCAAETDLAKGDAFLARTVEAARKMAAGAVRIGARKFVHLSTASVYESSSKSVGEAGKVAPWTNVAAASLRAEEAVRTTAGLPWVILRPAIVYGPGDVTGLMPR